MSGTGSTNTLVFILIAVVISVILYVLIRIANSVIRDRQQRQLRDESDIQPPNPGLKPADVEVFPTFIYRVTTTNDHESNNINLNGSCNDNREECSICLCDLEEEDVVRKLLPCRHYFHVKCIDVWLYDHSSCPVCREILHVKMVALHKESMSPPLPHFYPFKRSTHSQEIRIERQLSRESMDISLEVEEDTEEDEEDRQEMIEIVTSN